MSAGGPLLNGQPEPDPVIQAAAGIADLPTGQQVAVMITVLLPKDQAIALADGIKEIAGRLSSTRLVVATPGSNGANVTGTG